MPEEGGSPCWTDAVTQSPLPNQESGGPLTNLGAVSDRWMSITRGENRANLRLACGLCSST